MKALHQPLIYRYFVDNGISPLGEETVLFFSSDESSCHLPSAESQFRHFPSPQSTATAVGRKIEPGKERDARRPHFLREEALRFYMDEHKIVRDAPFMKLQHCQETTSLYRAWLEFQKAKEVDEQAHLSGR